MSFGDKGSNNCVSKKMASQYYKILVKRNKQLCKHFLDKNVIAFPETQLSQDKLRAYRLLVHAEIESYLETIADNKVKKSLDNWEKNQKLVSCYYHYLLIIVKTCPLYLILSKA
jgi:hypothetical protein